MITYKGDRFVKGKTFIHESEELKFISKSKKGYIFESADGKTITIENKIAEGLKEKESVRK